MFKEYKSLRTNQIAHEITEYDMIKYTTSSSICEIVIDGKLIEFRHSENIIAGDFIVYYNETDIYHCKKDVFLKRIIKE